MTSLLVFSDDYNVFHYKEVVLLSTVEVLMVALTIEILGSDVHTSNVAVTYLLIFNSSNTYSHFWIVVATGSIHNIIFSNIAINYYKLSWWDKAQPMYVTACQQDPFTEVNCSAHSNQTFQVEIQWVSVLSIRLKTEWQQGHQIVESHINFVLCCDIPLACMKLLLRLEQPKLLRTQWVTNLSVKLIHDT